MVSQELLNELKVILKEDFGLDLSPQEVSKIAASWITYFDLLIKVKLITRKD